MGPGPLHWQHRFLTHEPPGEPSESLFTWGAQWDQCRHQGIFLLLRLKRHRTPGRAAPRPFLSKACDDEKYTAPPTPMSLLRSLDFSLFLKKLVISWLSCWLCWVFLAVHELSLISASGVCSLAVCRLLSAVASLWSTGSRAGRLQELQQGLSGCG